MNKITNKSLNNIRNVARQLQLNSFGQRHIVGAYNIQRDKP